MSDTRPRVLVAHGWLGRSGQFRQLVQYLREGGFDATALALPTAFAPFSVALDIARAAAHSDKSRPLHLIGYSFGGLVMRALAAEMPADLSSLLLIGTPNEGSHLADLMCRVAPTPALRRLSTGAPPLPSIPNIPVGCIAGSRKGAIGLLIAQDNDGRVAVSSALGLPYRDARIIPVGHRALPFSAETKRLTLTFLRNGHF